MSLLKAIGGIVILGAAVGLVIKNDLDEKKKNKELDEFLLSDETEPVVVDVPVQDAFTNDILSIKNSPATIVFSLKDKDKCLLLQDLLSEKGLSSESSLENLHVNVIFNDEINEDNLNDLLNDLNDVLKKVEAKYEACR